MIDELRRSLNFIEEIVEEDLRSGRYGGRVHTRFPPEPNGFLHIGHVRAICIDFGIAERYGGKCNLRMDDTNPSKEGKEYVEAIQEDLHWLGFDWGDRVYYASDYFEEMFQYAVKLIEKGKAYVCDLSQEEIRQYRGTLTEPGRESPYRNRSVEENLELFYQMREGKFPDGSRVLRAKIDMASGNINMRDPVLYRIQRAHHHRTGDAWCIYPMYDFAHPISDAIEGITHSLCDLTFEDHRPLYDWVLRELEFPEPPRQIEFGRLNLTHTVTSKRKLRQLVEGGYVRGWDDPRMPTLAGLRRRGYTPEAIREFNSAVGISRSHSFIAPARLEHAVREDLNRRAPRVMAVLDPLKVVITNYPEDKIEYFEIENNPEDPAAGTRQVPFTREIYIERSDFMENPPRKYFRLAPGREVRLKGAYYITCNEVVKDPASGEIVELRCTLDPESRGGGTPDGRRVQGTLHWVSAKHALKAEVRLYDTLFTAEDPEETGNILDKVNPDSLKVVEGFIEESVEDAKPGAFFQFLRHGYFCVDPDSRPGRLVFNRTVTLRDSWEKINKAGS